MSGRQSHLKRPSLHFEALEPRILFDAAAMDAPVPEVSVVTGALTIADDQLVNDDIEFQITFDNTGGSEGYAPYVDFTAPPEMTLGSISVAGSEATNPDGPATTPIGEIGADGQLIEVGSSASPVPVNHPLFVSSIGNPPSDYYGGAGSGTAPVQYDVLARPELIGQYVYSVELPFGSYTADNPPLEINVRASLNTADGILPNQDYQVYAQGGFALGCNALDDPGTLAVPLDAPISGNLSSTTIYPLVMNLTMTASAAEEDGPYTGEQVSGPNHPLTYTLSVDVATGETVTGLEVEDVLPGDLAYLGNLQVRDGAGNALAYTLNAEPAINTDGLTGTPAANGTLRITIASVTGVNGTDVVVTYEAFASYIEGDSLERVINPATGEESDLAPYNDASIRGTWNGVAVSDNAGPAIGGDPDGIMGELETDYVIEEHSLAIQKGVGHAAGGDRDATGYSDHDVLEYALNFQVSDYFAFDDLIIEDILGDGLDFLPGDGRIGFSADALEMVPRLTYVQHGQSITVDFDPANYTAMLNPDGTTTVVFDVMAQLRADHPAILAGDPVLGGLIASGGVASPNPGVFNGGATVGSITYRALIRESYEAGPDQPQVSQGDVLANTVTISGTNLDITTLAPGVTVTDGSSASVTIPTGSFTKEFWAITSHGTTTVNPADPVVVPGDLVTYRLTYTLSISEFEDLRIEDFLPLPIFDVADIDDSQIYDWDPVTALTTAGRISIGPNDTFFGSQGPDVTGDGGIDDDLAYPSLTGATAQLNYRIDTATYASSNGVVIDLGSYHLGEAPTTSRTIELFITVPVHDEEFADRLFFTNQARVSEENTFDVPASQDAFVSMSLTRPELNLRKGVVATTHPSGVFSDPLGPAGVTFNAPGAGAAFVGTISSTGLEVQAIDANLQSIDAGDLVTFVITIENTGSSSYGAFDVQISDTLVPGFGIPSGGSGLNLRVTDGAGNPIAYSGSLFGGGILLEDPSDLVGSIAAYDAASGANLAIIAYDLVVEDTVSASQTLVNTAEIASYAVANAGANFAEPGEHRDDASVVTMAPVVSKLIIDTSHDTVSNDEDEVVIGEIVTYEVTVTLPEGSLENLRVEDVVEPGLAFLDFLGVTSVSGDLSSDLGALVAAGAFIDDGVNAETAGTILRLGLGGGPGLGTVTNANRDNAAVETLTFQYRAVVLNTASNQNGTTLGNTATVTWSEAGTDRSVTISSSAVTVIEPNISVTKGVSNPSPETDETITYTFTITNNGNAEAYEVTLSDLLPAEIKNATNLRSIFGVAPDSLTLDLGSGPEGTIDATWAVLGVGESSVFAIDVEVDTGLQTGLTVTNSASVAWSSLPGDQQALSPHNSFSDERSGDGADAETGANNDYRALATIPFTIPDPVPVKAIVDTSEAHTGVDSSSGGTVNAAVGEVLRYEVTLTLPQGDMPSLQLIDILERGLVFPGPSGAAHPINHITFELGGFTGPGSISADADIAAGLGAETVLDPARIFYDTVSNTVTFNFGDLTNNETDHGDPETLTLRYNVIVSNDSANVARGDVLTNLAQLHVDGSAVGPVASIDVTVVEPNISIVKTDHGVAFADAGDLISYTLTIANDSNAFSTTGFDLTFVDAVPDELEIVSGPTFSGLPAYVTASSVTATGQDISGSVNELRAGDSFEVNFQVRVRDTGADLIRSGDSIVNSASVSYSSLPSDGTDDGAGDNTTGTEAGTPGTTMGERQYYDNDSAAFTVAEPSLTKVLSVPADTTYTIGEEVEYVITVAFPEGRTEGVEVVDVLEAGMTYVSGSLTVVSGAGIAVGTGGFLDDANGAFFTRFDSGSENDESFSLNFGAVDLNLGAAGDGLATETIVVRYLARVDNIVANQNGEVRSNVADLNWVDGDGGSRTTSDATSDTDTDITVVEPDLNIAKTIVSGAGLDAGDTVTYQIQVTHTGASTADAFDLALSSALPDGLLENFVLTAATLDASDVSGLFAIDGTNTLISTGDMDLAIGEVLTLTVTGQVRDSANPADILSSTAMVSWSGIDGADANERGGADGPGGALNDYADSSTVNAAIQGVLDVTKSLVAATTEYKIDDTIGYQLEVEVAEGTLNNLTIVDTLPAGVTLDLGSVVVSNANGMTITGFNASQLGQILTITATSVLNPGNSDDPAAIDRDSFFITYEVNVDDVPGNVNGTILTNNADASADGVGDDVDNAVSITVVEPVLVMTKTLDSLPSSGDAGDVFTYTFTIYHDPTSGTDAQDVILTDVIPDGFELVSGSITPVGATPAPDVSSISGTGTGVAGETITLRWETILDTVGAGNAYEVQAQFRLVDTITDLDADIVNVATLNYDQDPDDHSGRAATPVVSAASPVDPDLAYAFTKEVVATSESSTQAGEGDPLLEDLVIGEEVTFELVATFGEGTTNAVVLTDTLPFTAADGTSAGVLEYVSSSITAMGAGITSIGSGLMVGSTGTLSGSNPDTITFDFGNILAAGNNVADSTITIRIVARVANVSANQDGDVLTNNATLSLYGGAQTLNASVSVEVVEPEIVAVKTITAIPADADAGDIVSYEVTIHNPTAFDAFDATLRDVLPPEVLLQTGTFTATSSVRGVVTGDFTPAVDGVTHAAPFTLAAGETITFTYDALITGAVMDGATYTSDVEVDWTSIDGANAHERDGDDGESGALDDYADSAGVSFVTEVSDTFAFDKRLAGTSAVHTGASGGTNPLIEDLVVGETVTFELVATIGNGTTTNVRLVDSIETVNGILAIQHIAIAAGANLSSSLGAFGSILPVISDGNLDLFDDQFEIDFGTVTNTGLAAGESRIVVTVEALVVNVLDNQATDQITNNATLHFDSDAGPASLSDSEVVEIVEPDLTAAKTITSQPAHPDAGDTVSYEVVLTNGSGTDAFDVTFRDALPPEMNLVIGSFSATSSVLGDVAGSFSVADSGVSESGTGFTVVDGETITLTYDVTILATVRDGQDLINTVNLDWTSLPGASGNERGGSEGPGGLLNDYAVEDSATVRSNLTGYAFTKDIATTSEIYTGMTGGTSPTIEDLVVGETVTYRLNATFAEGTTPNVRIVDRIQFGNGVLAIESVSIVAGSNLSSSAGVITALTPVLSDLNGDGFDDEMVIDLGTITNNALETIDPVADQIDIFVTARVVNVLANQDGDVIRNEATLFYDDEDGAQALSDFEDVELIEPDLEVVKALVTAPASDLDAGDSVTWEVVIQHTGTSSSGAYDVTFSDTLAGSVTVDFAAGVTVTHSVAGDIKGMFELVGNELRSVAGGYDLALGESITISISGVLNETLKPNEIIANEASIVWTSIDGVEATERGGDGSGLNDYLDSDAAAAITAIEELAIDKRLPAGASATYSVGETVRFEIEVTIMEGTTPALVIQDRLPAGMRYVSGTAAVDGTQSNALIEIAGITETWDAGSGQLTLELGDVVNRSVNDGADDRFVLVYDAIVTNVLSNQSGAALTNEATADAEDVDGDALPQALDDLTITVVEPELSLSKTVDNPQPKLGETLLYTLTVTNTGGVFGADAFDIGIRDLLPAGLTLNPASVILHVPGGAVHSTSISSNASNASVLDLTLDRLDLGVSVEVTFQAEVTSLTSFESSVITNTAHLQWTSTPGGNPDERTGDPTSPGGLVNDYDDTAFAVVEVFQPDLRISKDDGGAVVRPGDSFTYTLTVTNMGRALATGVVITDDISEFLANGFALAGVTPGAVTSGGLVTIVLPDIAVGDAASAEITLVAPATIPAGLEEIVNTANVFHDDIDPTPANNQDSDNTPIDAAPDLSVTKTDNVQNADVGDILTYIITYRNDGDQTASGVVLVDILPAGIEFRSATGGGGYGGGRVTWNLGELEPGESGTVTVQIRVWREGVVWNEARISDDGRGGADPTPGNNVAADMTRVRAAEEAAVVLAKDAESEVLPALQFDTNQNFLFGEGNRRGYSGEDSGLRGTRNVFDEQRDFGELHFHRYFRPTENVHHRLPTVLAKHMNSGLVQPGSTVTLEVYNRQGLMIGSSQTVADTGGNWVASFPTAMISEEPHQIVMRQTPSLQNAGSSTGYNFRTYFGPAFNTGTHYTSELTQLEVLTTRSATSVLQIYHSSEAILQLDWNNFSYEFVSISGTPGMIGG